MKDAEKKERLSTSIESKFRELREPKRDDARRERARAKEAKAAQRKEVRELKAKLRAFAKEFCREHANRPRPRSKTASRSEAELRALGGEKEVIPLGESRRQTRFIFGPEGQTRFIYTPEDGLWRLEGMPSREEQRCELAKSGRGLWDADKKMPVIAFHAVETLLSCFESFKGLPSNKQQAEQVQLAIIATLAALERDGNKGRKLQVAFEFLSDPQWPRQIEKLRHHALMLARDLERPPSKKELKAQFDPPLPEHPSGLVGPSEFSRRLKAAGLSWLKRGNKAGTWPFAKRSVNFHRG